MQTVIITGASRGIGFALTQYYVRRGDHVIALCRAPSVALQNSGADILADVDVSNPSCIERLPERLKPLLRNNTIDILINNAGIMYDDFMGELDHSLLLDQFRVNAVAPVLVSASLLSLMGRGSKIAMITSRMGSIADNSSGGFYGYRMSKAALNAASVSLAQDLAPQGIIVAILHPGFVQTDMVGGSGNLTAQQAAMALAQRIEEYSLGSSGLFRHSDGQLLPW